MKLSDFLFNIGRPVAFYPGLVKALGGMKKAVFICQMAYWKDKGSDPDGWIYKTAEEIESETSLTYKEQTNVRASLVELGALQERYARTEHQMYFRVNWDAVNEIWEEHLTKGHVPNGKVASSQKSDGILPKGVSLNSNTDTTQDTTHKSGGLSEKDIQQANAKVDAIIANSKKVKYQNRDKLPEPYLVFADLYFELTQQEPTKRVIQDWMLAFEDWKSENLQPAHIRAAWQHANRPDGGFPVGRPGALTNTAVAMKSKMIASTTAAPVIDHVAIENTKQMLQEKELVYVPMPDDVRAKLKKLSKQKEVSR